MPGSATTPGRPGAHANAPVRVAFRVAKHVGTRDLDYFAAQWLACMFPCRRFAGALTDAVARLGADADRYSFIVVDLHHLYQRHQAMTPLAHSRVAMDLILSGWFIKAIQAAQQASTMAS